MTDVTRAPADWYPDPAGTPQLRYWDGAGWTEHVAPMVTAPRPRRERAWTRASGITAAVCAVALVGSIVGATYLQNAPADGVRAEATATMDAFLEAAVVSDSKWVEFAAPQLVDSVVLGAPIGGDPTTADALDLTVSYVAEPVSYDYRGPLESDSAFSVVEFTYSYTLLEKPRSTSFTQVVWLTRPFYYGDKNPAAQDPDRTPSAIGPWRVSSLTSTSPMGFDEEFPRTNTLVSIQRTSDGFCSSPDEVLYEMSKSARVNGNVNSSCNYGDDGNIEIGDDVDLAELAAAFPMIDALSASVLPPELLQLEGEERDPLTQHVVAGDGFVYVLTLALAKSKSGSEAYRLISIQKVSGDKS